MFTGDLRVSYAGEEITLSVDPEAAALVEPVLTFVQPHFEVTPGGVREQAPVHVSFVPARRFQRPRGAPTRTLVRRRTPGKHVYGHRWQSDGWTILEVESSGTVFELADDGSRAHVHISETSQYHASDLLRDIMWELVSPTGQFVHAAAVCGPRGVIAFTGPKGAGKTTTAIDFLRAGAELFTGDVLFVASDGRLYGFPDYPHVGWGTLRAFPELYAHAVASGHEPQDDSAKVLLPHDLYLQALGARHASSPRRLHAVVAPDVAAGGTPHLRPAPPMPEQLSPMDRQTSDPGEGWEPFLEQVHHRSRGKVGASVQLDPGWFVRTGRGPLPRAEVHRLLGPPQSARGPEATEHEAASFCLERSAQ